ncbi:hypothetical protein N0V84_000695 [Fusarium piperis]|uniref:Uncharacterized protein n=1 Tax=Fusarium piperis TaxID=1435070 RepID=A0A9W8WMJ1_9HYPO|nr:hypothetical protein N0V84_000695 [Fusarium piperis]
MPIIIGVDVGGTNTDAVAIDLPLSETKPIESILGSAKIATTSDTSHGIGEALKRVIDGLSKQARDDIIAVNIGTTHFINAVVEKDARKLAKIAVLRLSGPYGSEVPPFAGLPDDLREIVEGYSKSLPGGLEIDGRVITSLDEEAVRTAAEEIRKAGIKDIAVIGIYSPIDSELQQEDRVAEILRSVLGEDINITLSHSVAGIGFIERENVTILNATILPFARRIIRQFQRSIRDLNLSASLFLTKNDGTLISAEDASALPVSTFLSGPTNSLTGAVFLANIQDRLSQGSLVLDIGGTTSDVCAVEPSGLPRPAAAFSHLAGVRTNFAVSDLRSIGIGGGSIVQLSDSGDVTVGPRSVGKDLTQQARVFGGSTLTTTDILVASGLEDIGERSLVSDITPSVVGRVKAKINHLLSTVLDEMKTTEAEVPVILVGGGSILCSDKLQGVSDVIRPPFAQVANAVGAAMARVSGVGDAIVHVPDEKSEQEAVRRVREQAISKARQNGADNPEVVEETILPVPYVSTRSLHIKVRAVGKLSTTGFKPIQERPSSLAQDTEQDDVGDTPETSTSTTGPSLSVELESASPIFTASYRPKILDGRWTLSQIDLDLIAEGCAILGCGGGGDVYASHLSVKKLIAGGGLVNVISPKGLPDEGFIPAVAVMGSPSTFSERLPSGKELENSVNAVLKSQGLGLDDLTAVMSLEIGGSNGMRGIQAALWTGKPLVDGDLMGRAYPNLWQVTPNNADISLAPAAASDGKGNTVVQVQSGSNRDIEDVLRAVCVQMGQAAGISLGALTGQQVKQVAVESSISLAWRLGRAVQLARAEKRDIVESILATHPGRKILTGKITSVTRHVRGAFTEGSAKIVPFDTETPTQDEIRVTFQNENIHAFRVKDQVTLASVPDLICLLDAEDGRALGTQDYRYGLRVHVVVLVGNSQWTQGEGLRNGGPAAFGLDIDYVPIAREKASLSVIEEYNEVIRGMNTMRLSEQNGASNLSDVAEAVNRVARGSDIRAASLTPEPTSSRAGTPRQRRRSRRSSSGVDIHNVLDEELPQDAFHSPEFQQAFRDAKQLMSTVEGVLGSSSLHNSPESTIRRLLDEAGELARFEYPSTRTVGFVGDSGVGKSSLLNSLLDVKGLARTSNSGEACTCVVTEFHYHSRDTLDIEVNLFTMDELQEQLTGMLQSYRHYHLHSSEMEDAERRDNEESANLARDTFRAMFRGRVFLNAHILSRGLILVDLPGLRDLNSARRMITERYLLGCNEIFAICNIGRAVTDEGVHQVFELARRARLSNDIIAEEAIRDWRGQRAKAIEKLMDAIATDKRDASEVNEDLSDYQGLGDDDLTEEEINDQRELFLRQANIRLKEYLVTTRNSFVTQELRSKYNERVATEIKIFCVSNKDYWDHRGEHKTQSTRFLQLSGILQVRKHCISIVANSQRRIATRYIKDQIPAFLAQVDLWVQSGARTASEERREALCRMLDDVERQLRRGFTSSTSVANRVAHSFNQDFATRIYEPTYAAFCRQYGDYCTPAVGPHNWNEELIDGMVQDLEEPWQDLCNSLQHRQTSLVQGVDAILNAASERFGR